MLRAAVLLCSVGAEKRAAFLRLREIALSREIYVEIVPVEPDRASSLVSDRSDALFVACAEEPHDFLDALHDAVATHGATLVVAFTDRERSIHASVDRLEDAILPRLDSTLSGRPET